MIRTTGRPFDCPTALRADSHHIGVRQVRGAWLASVADGLSSVDPQSRVNLAAGCRVLAWIRPTDWQGLPLGALRLATCILCDRRKEAVLLLGQTHDDAHDAYERRACEGIPEGIAER